MSTPPPALPSHPLWLVGFRPFFTLACMSGALLPVLWAVMFSGKLAPAGTMAPIQWHAHEMFYGFGWAVLGGFLLTASKNWVGIRGYHGPALMLLVAAWLLERAVLWWAGSLPPALFWAGAMAFPLAIVAMLLATLIGHRQTDSFADNHYFWIALPAFVLAKLLLLLPEHFALGTNMSLALFRIAFLVMLERTVTQFMKNTHKVQIFRHPRLDGAIKLLALALVPEALLPAPLAATLALAVAALLAFRFARWAPGKGMSSLDTGVMYLGYLAILLQLLLQAWGRLGDTPWLGSLPTHVFTFGAMGLVIPAMLVRISKGHTGRKVSFEPGDKAVLWIMVAAALARLLLPQVAPGQYTAWIHLSATCWLAAFALLGWRIIPFLWQPRVDGREH